MSDSRGQGEHYAALEAMRMGTSTGYTVAASSTESDGETGKLTI